MELWIYMTSFVSIMTLRRSANNILCECDNAGVDLHHILIEYDDIMWIFTTFGLGPMYADMKIDEG
jgi:hypothetical protein